MIPNILLDKSEMPDGGKEIRLYRHDKDFYINVGHELLMSSRTRGSEEALAEIACREIAKQQRPRVLIGGLGMGFTLRAALNKLPAAAQVAVAELVPAVVRWNRGPLAALAGNPLADKRVAIHEMDAANMIKAGRNRYDAILLDIDNGPEGLSRRGNAWFYAFIGLRTILAALRPEGVLAVWSVDSDRGFTARLNKIGFSVKEVRVRAHTGRKGSHHRIWIAKKNRAGKEKR